ncbi:PREDICTED: RAB6-interacting golgin [Papilio xuthus]|uniref:RAB6-interacting golgin n=1 Tax=Papilio xuthus TaxID=66420 RepID=A0A194QAV2_PAPXU|nr:PREDICTED: RAB6-interacting golgin [Papilio xuthus]KPJ02125.1 RAB6-interacting golgin [Papilio xuthus]
MSTFTGFSEEDLKRIKSAESFKSSGIIDADFDLSNVRKIEKIGAKPKKGIIKNLPPKLRKQDSDDAIDNIEFSKCKLSIRTPTTPSEPTLSNIDDKEEMVEDIKNEIEGENGESNSLSGEEIENSLDRRDSIVTPDIVRGVENYSEDELAAHRVKLQELQLKQKLMEEQNKKRKEMLSKALADRTRQTEEEVLRLEKIKKELQVLDGQFSHDVALLRKKIDQACLSYSEAEKQYLKVEKEFLQAKINLQKEKEKKELLTEHLCALITHNETRKAQKLETLMLELATDKKIIVSETEPNIEQQIEDKKPVIVDGIDERNGKMVEIPNDS